MLEQAWRRDTIRCLLALRQAILRIAGLEAENALLQNQLTAKAERIAELEGQLAELEAPLLLHPPAGSSDGSISEYGSAEVQHLTAGC